MTKKNVMISIDLDTHEEAKEKLSGRISAICEKALRKELKQDINVEEEKRFCFRCGSIDPNCMWDGFTGVWVCGKCHSSAVRGVSIFAKRPTGTKDYEGK